MKRFLVLLLALMGTAFSFPQLCKEGARTGPCKSHNPRPGPDASKPKCRVFLWGGCRANGNNAPYITAEKRTIK
ncbi:hypothetical protein GCK32_015959 [Trichostrongylus colubriformis]|uniref:BPTI/Kunitz inhibitor domain-containing protein n=1 Tax=Trichostrongylus colubriformis TaxID=6319 RepID=A0AAN8IH33_TRICO